MTTFAANVRSIPVGGHFLVRWKVGENTHAAIYRRPVEGMIQCVMSTTGRWHADQDVDTVRWDKSPGFEPLDPVRVCQLHMLAHHGAYERIQQLFEHGWPIENMQDNVWLNDLT